MIEKGAYRPLVQLLHPQIRYMGGNNSLLVPDALRGSCELAIFNIKLSRKRPENPILTYTISEFHVGDKVLVRNHFRDV